MTMKTKKQTAEQTPAAPAPTPGAPAPLTCETCGRTFKNKLALAIHGGFAHGKKAKGGLVKKTAFF